MMGFFKLFYDLVDSINSHACMLCELIHPFKAFDSKQ